jgi:TonB family protein
MSMRATSPISASSPADPYVRRIAAVCDMHRVPVGSPAELAGFLVALDEDKHLAMDFWAVIGKMNDEGSAYLAGTPLHERMLEVVVEAVTGLNVAEVITSSEESLETVERLSRLLGGEDLNGSIVADAPAIETADVEGKKPVGRAEMPSLTAVPSPSGGAGPGPLRLFRSRAEEPERAPVEIRPAQRPEERIASVQPIARSPDAGPRPFAARPPIAPAVPASDDDQSLERMRLMHWALQNFPANSSAQAEADMLGAKLNAAEIMAKYVPLRPWMTENEPPVKAPVAAGSGVVLGPALARVPEPVRVQSDRVQSNAEDQLLRVPDAAGLPPLELTALDLQHKPGPARVPLADYESAFEDPGTNQRIQIFKIVFGGVVSLGVVIGLLLAHYHRVGFWQSVDSSLQQMRGTFAQRAEPSLDVPNTLVVDPPPVESPPPELLRRILPRPPAPAPQARATSTKNLRTEVPIVRVYPSFSVPSAPATAVATSSPAGASPSDVTLTPGGTGPLPVPGQIMAANLLISRLPTYPDDARTNHAPGHVVMQAVINRDGTIGHLRVVEGDPALRNAALDAVSKWRYKPYTVNGQPVDVLTTVAVDFRPDQ